MSEQEAGNAALDVMAAASDRGDGKLKSTEVFPDTRG